MNEPMYDEAGMLLATPNIKMELPWTVAPSKRHEGRHYFFNSTTKESAWTLDPSLMIGMASMGSENKTFLPPLKNLAPKKVLRTAAQVKSITSAVSNHHDRPRTHTKRTTTSNSAPLLTYRQKKERGIDAASLVVVGGLGQGGFADVVEVKHMVTGVNFAMKVIAKNRLQNKRSRRGITMEHQAMTKIAPSPFVLRCHASFESATNIFFVMDPCSGGDLYSHFVSRCSAEDGGAFPEKQARVMLAELALAVEHVHGQGYLHKDIKIENVMLDHRSHVKLVDFGFAEAIEAEVKTVDLNGSWAYMAPELIRDRTGGRHTDWWAYGILAYEMLTGFAPWSCLDDTQIIKHEIRYLEIDFPETLELQTSSFLQSLLDRNFKTRLGTQSDREVRDAAFFEGIDWDAMSRQECAPAFVPEQKKSAYAGPEAQAALTSYASRSELPRSGDAVWYLGFEVLEKHPSYLANA